VVVLVSKKKRQIMTQFVDIPGRKRHEFSFEDIAFEIP
jgi:hypothetical protein